MLGAMMNSMQLDMAMRQMRRFSTLNRGAIFVAALTLAAALQAASTAARAADKAVLELFTSQGCSSCPPADRLLGKLIKRGDIIGLSLPVDYWDYLGWKDTLASPEYTRRQYSYRRTLGTPNVYTPQIVINGVEHAVGSHLHDIDAAIEKSGRRLQNSVVPVRMWSENDTIFVEAGAAPDGSKSRSATLWLALAIKAKNVSIGRGENSGREVTYYNVVRKMTPIGKWSGKKMLVSLPKDQLMPKENDVCTVLLQEGTTGPIIGAAELRN